jgi:hypothetical protein
MKKRRTPQKKKQLSLARDRHNDYAENDKSSRKNIARSRARKSRMNRRKARKAIAGGLTHSGEAADDIDQALHAKRPSWAQRWKKTRDTPLGEMLKRKRERRARPGQAGK